MSRICKLEERVLFAADAQVDTIAELNTAIAAYNALGDGESYYIEVVGNFAGGLTDMTAINNATTATLDIDMGGFTMDLSGAGTDFAITDGNVSFVDTESEVSTGTITGETTTDAIAVTAGTLNFEGVDITVAAAQVTNAGGDIEIDGGTLSVGEAYTNTSGTTTITDDGALTVVSGGYTHTAGTTENAGTLTVTAGGYTNTAGTTTNSGTMVVTAGGVTVAAGSYNQDGTLTVADDGVIQNGGSIDFGAESSSTITGLYDQNGGVTTIGADAAVSVKGDVDQEVAATITFSSTGTLTSLDSGSDITFDGTFNKGQGTLVFGGTTGIHDLTSNSSSIYNIINAGGSILELQDALTVTGTLTNIVTGTVDNVNGVAPGAVSIASLVNNGDIDSTGHNLTVTTSFANGGTMDLTNVTASAVTSMTNTGTMEIDGTSSFLTTAVLGGTVIYDGATQDIAQVASYGNLTLANGAKTAVANLDVTGTLHVIDNNLASSYRIRTDILDVEGPATITQTATNLVSGQNHFIVLDRAGLATSDMDGTITTAGTAFNLTSSDNFVANSYGNWTFNALGNVAIASGEYNTLTINTPGYVTTASQDITADNIVVGSDGAATGTIFRLFNEGEINGNITIYDKSDVRFNGNVDVGLNILMHDSSILKIKNSITVEATNVLTTEGAGAILGSIQMADSTLIINGLAGASALGGSKFQAGNGTVIVTHDHNFAASGNNGTIFNNFTVNDAEVDFDGSFSATGDIVINAETDVAKIIIGAGGLEGMNSITFESTDDYVGTLDIEAGGLNLTGATLSTVADSVIDVTGTFLAGDLEVNNTLTIVGNAQVTTLEIDGSAADMTLTGNLSVTGNQITMTDDANLVLSGTINEFGNPLVMTLEDSTISTVDTGSPSKIYIGAGSLTADADSTITFASDADAGLYVSSGTVDVDGTLTIGALSRLTATGAASITLSGDNVTLGIVEAGSSTITFDGANAAQTIINGAGQIDFNNLVVSNTGAIKIFSGTNPFTVEEDNYTLGTGVVVQGNLVVVA